MGTAYSNRGGWFGNQVDSTGGPSSLISVPVYILAASLFVSAGTGAFADDLTRLRQHRINKTTISNPMQNGALELAAARTSAEDVERIRTILSPAMSDLAKTFNVSRQTIYNWLKGEQPTPEHTAKLKDLASAADAFADAGVPVNGILLKRKVIGGKSLFEVVGDGGSARDAAQLLLQVVLRETDQRERLVARFAGRKVFQPSADFDEMVANDAT
jgi:DNA-binding transcriptional regulator YiaG